MVKVKLFLLSMFMWLSLTQIAIARESFDVVIVGAGGAGLSAAATASEEGASVLVLEKMPAIGGNTLKASGLFNAADPVRQKAIGIVDSPEWHYKQTLSSAGGYATPEVVRRFTFEALPTLHWLESLGIRFLPTTVATWGAEWPRGHKPLLPRGQAYIRTLSAVAIKNGAKIKTEARVIELIKDSLGRVSAVKYLTADNNEHIVIARKAVILASGGFAANKELVAKLNPKLKDIPTDNSLGSTGEVLIAAINIGAKSTGLNFIQCVPGAPEGRTYQVRLDLDAGRVIMLDASGKRFIDEDKTRTELAQAILSHPAGSVWMLTDNQAVNSFDQISRKDVYRGLQTGDSLRAESITELSRLMGLDADTVKGSVSTFNKEVSENSGKCGRIRCEKILSAPFWASKVVLNVHTTMGGLVITPDAQVVGQDNKPIKGLFAAGEITGNVHGLNRIGGNGISDAITFGRIAAKKALSTN